MPPHLGQDPQFGHKPIESRVAAEPSVGQLAVVEYEDEEELFDFLEDGPLLLDDPMLAPHCPVVFPILLY